MTKEQHQTINKILAEYGLRLIGDINLVTTDKYGRILGRWKIESDVYTNTCDHIVTLRNTKNTTLTTYKSKDIREAAIFIKLKAGEYL